jgi:hypothetical protein
MKSKRAAPHLILRLRLELGTCRSIETSDVRAMEPTIEAGRDPEGRARNPLGPVVQIDEGRIQSHLDELARSTVKETLNGLLDAEADELCGARKYERTEGRKDTHSGNYDRRFHARGGEVTLTVPKLRSLPFETAIIERYRRRESSVEEVLIEMSLAGVSVRRVEARRPCGERGSTPALRRPLAEAELVRRSKERLSAGGHRRGAERLSEDSNGERRRQGTQGELDELPPRVGAARPEGCAAVRLRQVPWTSGELCGVLSGSHMAACVVHFYRNVGTAVLTGKVKEWQPC